ncbi:MAG: thiamine/thiamine pyrophosphate ABC transporter permease [Rhizobiaceae bacterium]
MRDPRITAGAVALGLIALLVGGAFFGLAMEAVRNPQPVAVDATMLRVVRFTLWQAALSTVLSAVPAVLVARALSRCGSFPGRGLILKMFALPLALPAIVAALGVLALLGRAGYLAGPLSALSGETWPGIYGLSGILVAHVFFNMPLATRFLLEALDTVPADQWRLASQLGMGGAATFRFVEWPAIRAGLPGVAGLVFMLCVTSFTVVLTLGGGPAATTVEVAIYQALRFDFDPARAVALTALQLALTAAVLLVLKRLGADAAADAAISVTRRRTFGAGLGETVLDTLVIAAAVVVVAAPIVSVILSGLQADLRRLVADAAVHRAALTSVGLAAVSGTLAVALSLSLAAARHALARRRKGPASGLLERAMDAGAGYVLVVPSIVIGAGWFVLLRQTALSAPVAMTMVATVNAAMAMPFALRAIRPAYDASSDRYGRLAAQLGLTGWNKFRLVDWPQMRRPLATGLAFAMALSLGDLGVIALFGSDAVETLPYLLLARMGSYRTADAAGIALLLAALTLALMTLADLARKEAP